MSSSLLHMVSKMLFVIIAVSMVLVSARPNHFPENSQITSDQESSNSQMFDGDLKPWQVEMLIQRLAEINSQQAAPGGATGWAELRALRNPEVKRQSRYRQCYFNPISCFRK